MEAVYPTLSLGERDRRWRLIRGLMTAGGFDCLIVAGLRGREQFDGYVTNDSCEGIVVFPQEGQPTYLAWATSRITRYMDNLERGGTSWIDDWRVGATGPGLVAILREKGFDSATIGVVGLESQAPGEPEGCIAYKTWHHVLEHLPNATFVDVSRQFAELMLVKSKEELALLRHSARIGEMACEAMVTVTKPGTTESEIYATVIKTIFSNGANAIWPILNLQTGVHNLGWGPPMWLYRAQPPPVVQKGDIVQTEMFPCYGGMETQQQMSIALKPVHPINQELAEVARHSYEAGLQALRPGKKFREVARAMEVPITEAGCWRVTPLIHTLNPLLWVGPSRIGIDQLIAQLPGIEKYKWTQRVPLTAPVGGEDLVVKPGMVFAFEPNACRGKHRVNIGGTVVVTEDGVEELNKLPTEMQAV